MSRDGDVCRGWCVSEGVGAQTQRHRGSAQTHFFPEDFKDFSDVEDQLKAKHMFDEDDITYSGIIDAYDYLE